MVRLCIFALLAACHNMNQYIYNPMRATSLVIQDHYAYMIYIDEESNFHLMRYDLQEDRMTEIRYLNSRYQIHSCHIINGELYVLVNDGIYKMQYNSSGEVIFCGTPFKDDDFLREAFYRNEKIYYSLHCSMYSSLRRQP